MRKRLLLTTLAMMMAVISTFAVPAKPGLKKKVTLKDGSTVELTLKGDEHFSYYTDAKDNPCKIIDGDIVKMSNEEVAQMWTALRQQRMAQGEGRRAARRIGTPSSATKGEQRGLVLLVQFPDKEFITTNPKETFTQFFNKEGYSAGGNAGSVRDYFLAQSYDQLEINFDVYGPYTTKHEMVYYGKHYTDKDGVEHNDSLPQEMIVEAVDAAHNDGVDFSKYDWNNNGEVDQVFIIFAGYAEAQGAAPETIWPHEWQLWGTSSRTYNGKRIKTYGCAAELRGDGVNDKGHMDGIGTACHEFSHCLGLPDMYDTDGQLNYGMSKWDVMDAGSYLDNSCTPSSYTSYERWFAGWMEPEEITDTKQITDMRPLTEKGAKAYVIYNQATRSKGIKGEYYLLENRQPVGFDAKLPGHGLLILHVDYDQQIWGDNKINSNKYDHQCLTVIPADNELSTSDYGLAGDPWPGNKSNTILGNLTTPAATLYNDNYDGQKLMSKPISHIEENAGAKTVSFWVGLQEMPIPEVEKATEKAEGNSVTVTWNAVSEATKYELELIAKDKQTDFESTFDLCYSATEGTTDISKSLAKYGLENWSGSNLLTSPKKLAIGAQGCLRTTIWSMPSSEEITVVVGAESGGTDVSGNLYFLYINQGDKSFSVAETKSLHVKGKETQIFHFGTVNADYYALYFQPNAQMYLNYLAIYQGHWTAEQIGLISSQSSQAPRRAVSTAYYSSSTNSYTFTGLDANKVYSYRLRTIGEDGLYSGWSTEKTLTYGTTDIQGILSEPTDNATVRYFDMQGREVSSQTKGLLIRKQGNSVKKVIMK